MSPVVATPADAARARIARLEDLAARVAAELATERARLTRTTAVPLHRPDVAKVSTGTSSAAVRAWARTHGWPDLGNHGRMPADAITAYLTAHR